MELYIGLMSGTSVDGIDAALVDFSQTTPVLMATHYTPYPSELRDQIFALSSQGEDEIHRLAELDIVLGKQFALTVNALLEKQALKPNNIQAIGSHGHNIRHQPHHPCAYTLQIGDPNTIAVETGITTVADFRRRDIALGGQGAPLVPAFHRDILSATTIDRAIVNIGGIANITILSKTEREDIIGFDTGPGNTLMDAWINAHHNQNQDQNGDWARRGQPHSALLHRLLADHYFQRLAPKSTGREYFNLSWLKHHIDALHIDIKPVDVQTTLVELTARSIFLGIKPYFSAGEILVCGGGAHNTFLMERLADIAGPDFVTSSTQKYGIDPDWVEAVAFAWLARQTLNRATSNLPSVTGAKKASILGGVYFG